jgi:hypothetical protein
MRRTVGVGVVLLLLAGCAPTWTRAGVTKAEMEGDVHACTREAEAAGVMPTGPYGGLVLVLAQSSYLAKKRELLEDCLRARGYRTVDDPPEARAEDCPGEWVWKGRAVICKP